MKSQLKAPGTKRLKLKYDILLSSFAFNFYWRRYATALTSDGQLWAWGSNAQGQLGRLECVERSHHPSKPQPMPLNATYPNRTFGGYAKGNGTGCEAGPSIRSLFSST